MRDFLSGFDSPFAQNIPWHPRDMFLPGDLGFWMDPSDATTMFSDTIGATQVTASDPVAWILDRSKRRAYGAELVTNGTFDSASGWTLDTGASISGGVLSWDGTQSSSSNVTQTISGITVGDTVEVTFDLTVSNYIFKVTELSGTGADSGWLASSGSYTLKFKPGSSSFSLVLRAANGAIGSMDNVSMRVIAGTHAQQLTGASQPTYTIDGNGESYLDHATGTKSLGTSVADMGTAATVAYVTAGGVTINTGQTIGAGSYTLPQTDWYGLVVIDRALSASETQRLGAYLASKVTGVSYP